MAPSPNTPHSAGQVLPFRQSIVAMLGLCFCTMMVALDQTVVGTALPTIVSELKGFEYYAWVATSYLLTSVITVPIFGRLGDFYGRKPFVVAAIIIFTAASVLCGASNSMLFLVIARALQGIGGGMLVGTAFACIPELFPDPHVRLRWQVMLSSAFGIANAIGPSLGGFLTEAYGWRSVFYVNLPVGLLGLWFVGRHLPHMRAGGHGKASLDWLGAILITATLGSLQMLVEWLPADGLSRGVLMLLVLLAISSYALYWWERRTSHPIVPFEMFRDKKLAPLFVLSAFAGFTMFGVLFYAPLLLQGGFGLSPRETGLLITPMVVCITVGSIVNGRLITRLPNPNVMLYGGFFLLALACAGVITTHRGTPHALIATYMLFAGLGLGFVMPNLTVFAQEVAGPAHLGIATALMQSLRMIGGMLGTAIVGTLVNHSYTGRVTDALAANGGTHWVPQLADPQILVNAQSQSDFLSALAPLGQNGALFIESARTSLVAAIHNGQMMSLAAALAGLWFVKRVPLIRLTRGAKPQPPVGE
ncbi:MDR family MFS transporter [Pandoraea cepalis]|uniref:MFS transporter n=1 Tax=Pandoraea cepalis TaxID=2508294 RepID=A0A5E4SLP9_9BURK|nr:MDR family MFS transporter [Pandoraea cepalis]VVD75248.1 MFS transporter [Pandoraea cepalis]